MFLAEGTDGLGESAGEVDGCVADTAEGAGGFARAEAAGIVAQHGIQHLEAAVLDVPAAAQMFPQERGVRSIACETGDRVGRARACFSLFDSVAFQADELFRAGPVEVVLVDERGCRRDAARLEATAILLDGLCGRSFLVFFTHRVGGEKPSGMTKACSMSRRSCG